MVTLQFGYYGANTWLPSYLVQGLGINLKNVGWYVIFGFFYGVPYAILATYISESFPTKIRGTVVASTNAFGRAGSMLSPLMIGIVAEKYSIGYGIALMGISYALCALIPGLFIREKMYDPKSHK
ncbi:MFS transporter [Desulfosporosinus metallidurans]